ncbi:hypothetical protein D6853_08095 [Butyrivibrio sp. X503]|uniref:transglutaminase domain-containing protein n=1 Tax=Butyrivibrio sp. X503 TaxID=2364878 RepID=UPI000EAA9EC3|nr:transglutaminase domain-containing protein [Butyrivibrio sp. X503]RKM55514.1 hypothetical protein D6853_08095 [Butyrivibrio sp. X503]
MVKGKRIIAVVMALMMITATGCSSKGIDEYLETLGLKDSEYDEATESQSASNSSEGNSYYVTSDEDTTDNSGDGSTHVEQNVQSDFETFYKKLTGAEEKEMQQAREDIGLTEEGIAEMKKEQEGRYYYEKLSEAGKNIYVEILAILKTESDQVALSAVLEDDAVEKVFSHVMNDHCEIFWVDGYKLTKHKVGNDVKKLTFTGNYLYDKTEIESRQSKINEYVSECLANAPSSDDDYYAIKYVYDYIINHTEYVSGAPDNQNICSVFITGKSVCNGYAKATQYLLEKLGVECVFVEGLVQTDQGEPGKHAWNLVKSNDSYYYVDTTWGDSSYQGLGGSSFVEETKVLDVNYDYLCVTTKDIMETHTLSDIVRMPECNSLADNYYVREDEYFKSDDINLVKDLFDRRKKDGSDNVTIKCATDEVFDSLYKKLIDESVVFEYVGDDKETVSYTVFKDSRTIIFWL